MAYLTYDEFKGLVGDTIPEKQFNELLPFASSVLDVTTNGFYQFHDLPSDVAFRRDRFMMALAAQIKYFTLAGDNSFSISKQPTSQSIGETSISYGNGSTGNVLDLYKLIARDAEFLLQGTGLLYRGVGGCGCR